MRNILIISMHFWGSWRVFTASVVASLAFSTEYGLSIEFPQWQGRIIPQVAAWGKGVQILSRGVARRRPPSGAVHIASADIRKRSFWGSGSSRSYIILMFPRWWFRNIMLAKMWFCGRASHDAVISVASRQSRTRCCPWLFGFVFHRFSNKFLLEIILFVVIAGRG